MKTETRSVRLQILMEPNIYERLLKKATRMNQSCSTFGYLLLLQDLAKKQTTIAKTTTQKKA